MSFFSFRLLGWYLVTTTSSSASTPPGKDTQDLSTPPRADWHLPTQGMHYESGSIAISDTRGIRSAPWK
jgi:hypothetical protein